MSHSFPAPTPADWRTEAEKALKGRPLEGLVHLDADGLAIRPLYSPANGAGALSAPRASDAEGRAWDLRATVEGDDPAAVNAAVLTELQNGAASLLVAGAVLADPEPLGRALEGVALELAPVALDAGIDGPDAANALAVVAKGSPRARLLFHMDPISAFARAGGSPRPIEDHVTLAANTAARHAGAYPEARFFLASGQVAHEAGGSLAQSLAFALASAVSYVRAGMAAGLDRDRALDGVVLGLAVDQQYFDSLCALRALRLLWANVSRAFGAKTPAVIEARSSRRMLSRRDPWPNLLRLTAAGFAGGAGGADAVVLDGFTRAEGRPDAFARRQARNTQLVLMEEANLGRVDDPAAGSWFLDHRTRDLAQAAWAEFQWIESEGGVVETLKAGLIQPRVARARARAEAALKDGAAQIIGVTQFVDPDPRPISVEASAEAIETAPGALAPVRLAEPFEAQAEASR